MKKSILLMFLSLLPILASADDSGFCGDNVTYTYAESTHTLTISGSGAMANYTNNNYAPWYSYRSEITKVVIEDGVTSIGEWAFDGCSGLTSVTIPNSVTSIGSCAFYNCSGLTSVSIPNSVATIGSSAFSGCSGLTSVTIPNSVTSIGNFAFWECSGLTSVTIGNSVTSIGDEAFYNCSGLTSVSIGNSVTSIGNFAFWECSGLTSVNIPNSVTSIGYEAFSGCSGLTSVTIPNSVTSIGDQAFEGCSGLTSVTIGNSVTSIGYRAFFNCSGLASVSIPGGVSSIGSSAFQGCSGLESVKVSVTDFAAFCNNSVIRFISSNISKPVTLIDKDGNEIKEYVIPNGVTSIGNSTFYNCSGLTSMTIPASVTSIGSNAFDGCVGLESVTFHCSSIGNWFSGVTSIKEVIIGDEVTSIRSMVFRSCNELTSIVVDEGNLTYDSRERCNAIIESKTNNLIVGCKNTTIPNSVTSIGGSAFQFCSGLTSVTIPNSVTSIGYQSFYKCSGLTSVTIPNSVTSIGDGAFSSCTALTSVTICCSLTSIGSEIFSNCSNLSSITFRCQEIPSLFRGLTSINEVIMEEGVTSIGGGAFSGCSGLTSVTIGNSVTTIGRFAFEGCSGLTSVTIPNCVTSIEERAFYGCSGLTSITMGNGVTSIGYQAFYNTGWYNNQDEGILYLGNWLVGWKGKQPTGDYVIVDGTKGIACNAFESGPNYTSVTSVTIPNSVMSIGIRAFYYCKDLTSVTIGNGVTSIEERTFEDCRNLTTITIPSSVKSIGVDAFYGCRNISSVYISDLVAWCNITFLDGWSYYGGKEYANPFYANNEHHLYLNGNEVTNLEISQDATAIHEKAFYNCKSITSVTIPNSVTSIGSNAFSGCTNLLTVNSEIAEPFNCGGVFSEDTQRKGVLNVPAGTKDLYTRFDGWREFLKIEEVGGAPQIYQLSFVLDNKEILKQEAEIGATITPPTEDGNGNTISWYTYPAMMPAHDLVVYGMVVKEPEPEVFVWLTIKDGQGTTKMKLKKGTKQELVISPEEGWRILSVAMDGTDVTALVMNGGSFTTPAINSDDSIIIVYEQEVPSGVRATQSQTNVKVVSDGVVISNAEPETRCVIYSMDGQQVVNTVISEGTRKITLQQGQVYILTIDGRTLKFAL